MALFPGKSLLHDARKNGYAVGAFNTNNLEITKAIINAAASENAPIFLQLSSAALKYGGFELAGLAMELARKSPVPVALHLDHGKELGVVKDCIGLGFSSVMIDGSALPFEANVLITRKVSALAHRKGVSVEAELGQLKGREDEVFSSRNTYTDPKAARLFVEKTGCDSLAVAVGTSHGAYKFSGVPRLDLERLSQIHEWVGVPLVLHGASSVPKTLVSSINRNGGKISGAAGVPEFQIRKAVRLGICKVNEDTDLRLAFTSSVRKFLNDEPGIYDPREILSAAISSIQRVVSRRIRVLGSRGRSWL